MKSGTDFISYTQNIDTTTAMGRLFSTLESCPPGAHTTLPR